MRNEITIDLNSRIFQDKAVLDALDRDIGIEGRALVRDSKQRMTTETKSGRLYGRRAGQGFKRFHRASARFERPAVDTGKLLNSIHFERKGQAEAIVTADATANGFDYPAHLQNEMDRPTFTDRDVAESQRRLIERSNRSLLELF